MITKGYRQTIPSGAFRGDRAITSQSYDEMNKKRGTQWEAARRIIGATTGQKFYSCIKVGNTWPIDLKSRILGYTGDGVIGRMFMMPLGSELTAGLDPDPVHNMRASGGVRDFEIYTMDPTFVLPEGGFKFGPDITLEGTQSNQAKGHIPTSAGSNKILDVLDREYILEIVSLSDQNITARLEMYHGPLDTQVPVSLF